MRLSTVAIPSKRSVAGFWAIALVAGLMIDCAGATGSASHPPIASASSVASAPPVPAPTATGPVATTTAAATRSDTPPSATMRAEGGDPVTGQLGSYTWGGSGSDSPWLPGSPMTVGAGEPLTITFADASAVITDWTAARVPARTTDGSGAVSLGSADGEPVRFLAPVSGRWSVQVQVRFEARADSAAYYWLLDVR